MNDVLEKIRAKKWYKSKTLWVNVIAIVAMILSEEVGYTITPQVEVSILAGINFILRIVTQEKIVW